MPDTDDGLALRARIRGAFLGAAQGDAFGRPLEGASASDLRSTGAVAARASADEPWSYSDDTEMLLGVAESVIACGGVEPEHLLRTLARNYDPARGYGHGAKRAFDLVRSGAPWRRAAFATWPEGSRGTGAAVRVVPVACLYHRAPDRLDYAAQSSAAVTHAHRIARVGAMLQARAIATLLSQSAESFEPVAFVEGLVAHVRSEPTFCEKIEIVLGLLASHASIDEAVARLGNGVTADEAVPLAIFAFARSPMSFETVITDAVSGGGDTDTIAALSGALAGALLGDHGLPQHWLACMEDGDRGLRYVVTLADAVCERT